MESRCKTLHTAIGALLQSFVMLVAVVVVLVVAGTALNRTFTQAACHKPLAPDNGWQPTGNHCNRFEEKKNFSELGIAFLELVAD